MPMLEPLVAILRRTFLRGKAVTLRIRKDNDNLSVDLMIWAVAVVVWLFVWLGG